MTPWALFRQRKRATARAEREAATVALWLAGAHILARELADGGCPCCGRSGRALRRDWRIVVTRPDLPGEFVVCGPCFMQQVQGTTPTWTLQRVL